MLFDTTEFEFSHGKKPKGRGSWAFAAYRNAEGQDVYLTPSVSYSEAKKLAAVRFKGEEVVYVLP